jgi:hypothetical protein
MNTKSWSSLNETMAIALWHEGTSKTRLLEQWVRTQRKSHTKNKIRLDRKKILDEIGFAYWKAEGADNFKPYDKLWHQQYDKALGNSLVRSGTFIRRTRKMMRRKVVFRFAIC